MFRGVLQFAHALRPYAFQRERPVGDALGAFLYIFDNKTPLSIIIKKKKKKKRYRNASRFPIHIAMINVTGSELKKKCASLFFSIREMYDIICIRRTLADNFDDGIP